MKKICLVTGASSGIGKATAIKFAENGYDVIITGRRKELLEDLKKQIENNYKTEVLVLCFDIKNLNEVKTSVASIPENWRNINILINNAGLAVGLNTFDNGIYDDWERMIDTNIKGLIYMTKEILPLMLKNNSGHIINVGSIAGKEPYVNGNVYCASKAAVDMLTKTMRMDLFTKGIKVSQVAPGAAETEFSIVRFKGDVEKANAAYKGFKPLLGEDIADIILYIALAPVHVNIADVLVLPSEQGATYLFDKKGV